MRILIDINTGLLKKDLNGTLLGPLSLFSGDLIELEIGFLSGAALVTATVLAGEAELRVAVKTRAGASGLLAIASEYTIVDGYAVTTLDLNTTEVARHFEDEVASGSPSSSCIFEVQVNAADDSSRRVYHQSRMVFNRGTNDSIEPSELGAPILRTTSVTFRQEITARTGGGANALDAVVTLTTTPPATLLILVDGTGELWALTTGTDEADGTFIVRPLDFHAVTNPKVWKRIL